MPDEREMAEINETIHPEGPPSRAERRRIMRDQPPADRVTGIKRCAWCHYEVELDREPLPDHCPACGVPEPYDDPEYNAEGLTRSIGRRHAAAVESVAGAIEIVGEAVNRLADVFGDIGEAIAQRVGKAGR